MHLRALSLWSVMAASLIAGCGSRQAPAGDNSGRAYELVMLQKPDSVESYTKVDRGVYDLCVASAQANHTTAKPFPQLPASLGTTRSTYLIRGRDRVVREEMLGALDMSKDTPDHQCEVTVTPDRTLHVDLVVGVTHTWIGTDEIGQPLVKTEDISDLRSAEAPSHAQSTAKYTEPDTINGVHLRCLPKGKPPLDDDQLQEMCVYAHDGVLVEPDGKPLVLASRVRLTPNYPVTIKEPQSLRTIEHPDASQFNAATYAR
jgi:hypothetical protein